MLLDTSGLLCYHHRDEVQHEDTVAFFNAAPVRLTHSYVIAEFIPLCQVRGLQRSKTLDFVYELLTNPYVEIVWVDKDLHHAALSLLQDRLDKTYSLCDAVSFVLMKHRNLYDALTTDHHFQQEGFVRLLQP